jgi:hypothetical protein
MDIGGTEDDNVATREKERDALWAEKRSAALSASKRMIRFHLVMFVVPVAILIAAIVLARLARER